MLSSCFTSLVLTEKILVVIGCKVCLGAGLSAQRFAGTDQLQIVQSAGDTLVAVAVESVQVDRCPAVHAGVNLGAGQHGIAVGIYDAGSGGGVSVDERCV